MHALRGVLQSYLEISRLTVAHAISSNGAIVQVSDHLVATRTVIGVCCAIGVARARANCIARWALGPAAIPIVEGTAVRILNAAYCIRGAAKIFETTFWKLVEVIRINLEAAVLDFKSSFCSSFAAY